MQNNVYSVSQVNKYIGNMFKADYLLTNIEVRGELSNVKYHSSGHIYFTLKDDKSAIKAVMFASYKRGLSFRMEEGMQVVVKGSCEVFERDGSYQLYAREIRQDGIGNLFEEFEKLKQKLSEQGMFDPIYKRPIPKYVKKLGVVTAPTGAAVRDIIDVSKRRNPGIQIILYPAIVQGAEAPESIVKGIEALQKYGVDVIIVGRGGGSMEDLWGFNDEGVANAIFNATVPIISAVGHETDFTIADFVSDLRAPTPSAAAELAVCDVSKLLRDLEDDKASLSRAMNRKIFDLRKTSAHLERRLLLLNPSRKLEENRKRLLQDEEKLSRLMNERLKNIRHELMLKAGRLEGQSPLKRLSGGYSYVADENGKNIKSVENVSEGAKLNIYVTDGVINASVTGISRQER